MGEFILFEFMYKNHQYKCNKVVGKKMSTSEVASSLIFAVKGVIV